MSHPLNSARIEALASERLPQHWNNGIDHALLKRATAQVLLSVDRNLQHFGDSFPSPSGVGQGWKVSG